MYIFRHDELLASQGAYYEMWQQQLTKLEEESVNGNSVDEGVDEGSTTVAEGSTTVADVVVDKSIN